MISGCLSQVAQRYPNDLAMIDGDQRISHGELSQRVLAAREWLRATLHPRPGDVIALSLDNSWQFVACVFAVSGLGGVLFPCNPQWRAVELRAFAARVGFRGAVIEPRFSAEWDQIRDAIPNHRLLTADRMPVRAQAAASSSPPAIDSIAGDAPALYISTSGSMGVPRLVPRSHRNLIAMAENVAGTLDIGSGRRVLSVVPFHHSSGLNNGLIVPLLSGATVATMRQFSPAPCAELVQRENVDTLFGSPFIFGCLVDCNPTLLSSLKHCFTAGGRIPASVVDRWRARLGPTLRQFYGLSECGMVACERAGQAPAASLSCVGQPIRGAEVIVLGTDNQSLEHGATGELAIRSASVMAGYLGEPELNRRLFHQGFFRTGDLGCFDSAGNLHLNGRLGRVMNLAGVKVDPVQVERTVEMLPNVASCHVDTVPNGRGGEVIRARVVAREGLPVTRRDVLEHCRRQLAEYKLPRVIEFLETTPLTIAGKIAR
jgi:acyl-CoA synthetase (AMP-forming)/AMP-acid ligase II